MDDFSLLIQWIKESKKTVFFGGAGVSTESGLKDFRSKDGLYYETYDYPPEEILSHDFFFSKPEEFFKFYREKLNVEGFHPNITHEVLTLMEKNHLLSSIITQNIDGFHTDSGSNHVLELHGSIKRNYCTKCHQFYDEKKVFQSKEIPHCSCGGIIKPDVVLYEEALNNEVVLKTIQEIESAEVLIIGGTSLNVYPAAGFIHYFHGKHLVLINLEKTSFDSQCELVIHKKLGEVFQKIKEELF